MSDNGFNFLTFVIDLNSVILFFVAYPGQVLYLCIRSDAGIAFLASILHIAKVEHTGNDVQQLLHTEGRKGNEKQTG